MARPSKIDRLPPEIREEIAALREKGYTLDEILGHLRALDIPPESQPSRSGLGRHIQGLDALAERLQKHRAVAEALVRRLGTAPESKSARLNIELMHDIITRLQMAEGEDGEGGKVTFEAADVHFLSKALDHLARAEKNDVETILKLREAGAETPKPDEPTGPTFDLPDNSR